MLRITFILSLLVLSVWAVPTLDMMKKEARVAIVVGNGAYDETALQLPTQNARAVRDFLEKNGFYVYYGENLDKRNFIRLLRKFNKKMRPGGVGLLYFSGHIVQTKDKNYLVPVESGIHKEAMIARQCVSLNSIYSGMQHAHNRLNIVILDNERKPPFGSLFTMKKEALAPIKYYDDFSTFVASYPGTINDSDTFTQDFLRFAGRRGLELRELRSDLTCHRQLQKQPKPHIDLAKNRPFYFNLPERLPAADEYISARNKKDAPIDPAVEINKRDNGVSAQPSPQPEEKAQKNAIGITISEPGSEAKADPIKTEEGEKRHILLQ